MDAMDVQLREYLLKNKSGYLSKNSIGSLLKNVTGNSDEMEEKKKAEMSARIEAKLKAGKKLTPKEAKYLQQTNPYMYQQYLRIRQMAEQMTNQLKHAKSKQQANDIITTSIAGVSDKDPCKEYIIAALNEVAKEFKKTEGYNRLPATDAEVAKKNKQVNNHFDIDKDEDDDCFSEDEFDPMEWSPLQEIIDAMPTFNMPA